MTERTDQSLIATDIDAVREAVAILTDADFQVTDVRDVDRRTDDGKVGFTLDVEADTRTKSLEDFE